jgi:hypothetical protein
MHTGVLSRGKDSNQMARVFWSDERYEEARRALADSVTTAEAAAKMGLTEDALHSALRRRGIPAVGGKDPVQRAQVRQEAYDLRAEHRELTARVKAAEDRADVFQKITALPPVKAQRATKGAAKRTQAAVILASDWHYGQLVDPARVSGRNAFDISIAEQRISNMFENTVRLIRHNNPEGQLHAIVLCLMGDLLHGDLHVDKRERLAGTPTGLMLRLTSLIESGIRYLADQGLPLHVACVAGNHGRTAKHVSASVYTDYSYEQTIYMGLRERLPRVSWGLSDAEDQYFTVLGWRCHISHGRSIRYNRGIGGLAIPLLKAATSWDTVQPCDYHFIGHYHQRRDFHRAAVNGSLVGYDTYASCELNAPYEEPSQTFMVFDQQFGKSTVCPIWLESTAKKGKT